MLPFVSLLAAGDDEASSSSVNLAVEYYPRCSHCARFLATSVAPFVEAGMPGDTFKFSILPWVDEEVVPKACTLTTLCALKETFPSFPKPSPADAPSLKTGVKFVACAIAAENSATGCTDDALKDCAAQAGLSWETLHSCATGPEASKVTAAAMSVMHYDASGPSPFVNVNDKCESGWDGSLIVLGCQSLQPRPFQCDMDSLESLAREQAMSWLPKSLLNTPKVPCENCWEMGSFHWSPSHGDEGHIGRFWIAGAVSAMLLAAVAVRTAWRWSWSPTGAGSQDSEALALQGSDNEHGSAVE